MASQKGESPPEEEKGGGEGPGQGAPIRPSLGLRAQLHIPCHLLHTLLKPLSLSQPHVLSQGLWLPP